MRSVRQGLRDGELEKDTFGRLECTSCGVRVDTRDRENDVGQVRSCPHCEREWYQI